MKRFLSYVLALALGVLLMLAVTPYARAHRADPSKVGGEALLPGLAVLVCFRIRDIKRTREVYFLTHDTDEDDE